jgi:aspartate aminotransferase-like enzyme
MFDIEDNIFMLAGPVKIHRRVLDAMSRPSVAHRGKEFSAINAENRELLKYLFQSDNDVAIISGSGTAGLETAVVNLLKKGDKTLIFHNGKFGERLFDLSKLYANAIEVTSPWGQPPDLDAIAAELETGEYKAVGICHNETSTGMTNPAEEIGKLAKKNDTLFILDGITSVGGLDVKPDKLNADIVIFGSQKCIAAPAGLACLSVSEQAKEQLYDDTSYYLNLKKHLTKLQDGDQTPYTPAIPLFLALREALLMIKEEGLENRLAKIEKLAEATRSAVNALGLELFPHIDYASNTVTAINYPEGINDKEFRDWLRDEHNVIVAGAQAHIKGKVFRIGTMGLCSFTDLAATFAAVEASLKKFEFDFEIGAGVRAIVEKM